MSFINISYLELWYPFVQRSGTICAILTKSKFGLLHVIFCIFVPELWPMIHARNFSFAQYLENKLTELHQILYMASY